MFASRDPPTTSFFAAFSLLSLLRRDPNNYRPRINKANSIKDCEQKLSG